MIEKRQGSTPILKMIADFKHMIKSNLEVNIGRI